MPPKKESLGARLRKAARAQLEQRDVFGRAAIHAVCLVGRHDLLATLLTNPQCQPSLQDRESGWTALHYAVFYGRLSCARLLIEHDYGLMKVKDRSGLTAMDLYHLTYNFTTLKIFPQSVGKDDTNYTQRIQIQEKKSAVAETAPEANNDQPPPNDQNQAQQAPVAIETDTAPPTHSRTPVLEDPLIWFDKDTRGGSDVYTFGSNVNYQLATGDSDDRLRPYLVQIDNRRSRDESLGISDRLVKPRIKDIRISKNHSVLLTNEETNNILIAGNGSRGRLGTGSSNPNYRFKTMDDLSELRMTDIAVSDDHTLALTSDGDVYAWGLNNYFQLGYQTEKIKEKTDTFSDVPKRIVHPVLKKLNIKGISCSKLHSCAYVDSSLVVWGLNVGQMDFVTTGEQVKHGKLKGSVQVPRKIDFSHNIKQVIATEEATIVHLINNECHILTNGNHLRFSPPLYKALNNEFELFRPTRFSKKRSIIKLVSKDATRIGILYDDGSVSNFGVDMFSKSSNIKYTDIWNPRNDHLKCVDVDIGKDGSVVIITKAGCVYKRVQRNNRPDFKFTKIDRISKVVKVSCDSMFSSFGFIKDDVDQLPLQLMKNRFFLDINYLSPLETSSPGRKQGELVNIGSYKPYTINFLHKPHTEITPDDDTIKMFQKKFTLEDTAEKEGIQDPLLALYKTRWTTSQEVQDTFEHTDVPEIINILTSSDPLGMIDSMDTSSGKGYDIQFDLDGKRVGVHKSILYLSNKMSALDSQDVVIDNIHFFKISDGVIKIENLHPVSLLIMINMLYTGSFVKPWDRVEDASSLSQIKTKTIALLKYMELIDDLQRPIFKSSVSFSNVDNFDTDVIIRCQDGEELRCWSNLLKVRNAYFETLFSERWEEDDVETVLEFPHVRKEVFEVALKYIYGCEQLELLDDHYDLDNVTDFINFCFELIELSDELMLFGLKDFGQLMIKDFITCDNMLLILHHADTLHCQKLIGVCLWFIYNNVDSLLVDPNYELLSNAMIKKIDKYSRWLKRVNKTNPNDNKEAWYDGDSTELLTKFLNDQRAFNDIFLESDDFVPLFDIPPKKEPKSPKLEPKKAKLPSPPPLFDSRKPSFSSQTPRKPSAVSMSRKSSVNDSAIADDDDDFQPVMNRRRRSSANRRSSNNLQTPISVTPISMTKPGSITSMRRESSTGGSMFTPTKSVAVPSAPSSSRSLRHSSMGNAVGGTQSWPEFGSSVGSPSALSPMSAWGSTPTGSSVPTPVLGSSPSTSSKSYMKSAESPSLKNTVNFGSTSRMSQKDRKRMMKTEIPVVDPVPDSPWKLPSANGSSSSLQMSSLALAQEEAMAEISAQSVAPSLKGIMHEEEHKLLEDKKVKSFAEVQQEEEFAKWWEEESRRVQQQINGVGSSSVVFGNGAAKTSGGGGQKKKNSGKRKFDRPYRKQSVP